MNTSEQLDSIRESRKALKQEQAEIKRLAKELRAEEKRLAKEVKRNGNSH